MLSRKGLRCIYNPVLLMLRCSSARSVQAIKQCDSIGNTKSSRSTEFYTKNCTNIVSRTLSTGTTLVDASKFEVVCDETLESLCDYFEELVENCTHLKGADVLFGDGVLTVSFGDPYGTYVINRQTPNRQIWLSSPVSGPKRYDFVMKDNGFWIYKHDGVTLHQLLQKEINKIVKDKADFSKCSHSLI